MKKWSLILALFLCIVAVGGLAVLFHSDKESTPTDKNDSSAGGSSYDDEIDGIDLNETNLIF